MAEKKMVRKGIEFPCAVNKVQTLTSDNSIRVTLDLPETATSIMGLLAECQRNGWILTATLITVDDVQDANELQSKVFGVE